MQRNSLVSGNEHLQVPASECALHNDKQPRNYRQHDQDESVIPT